MLEQVSYLLTWREPIVYFKENTRIRDFRMLKLMSVLVACFFSGTNQILKTFVIEGLLINRRFRARYLGFCDGEEFQRIFFPENFVAALFHRIFLYFHTKIELSGFVRIRCSINKTGKSNELKDEGTEKFHFKKPVFYKFRKSQPCKRNS